MKASIIILTVIGLGVFFASPGTAQRHAGQAGERPTDNAMMHDHMGSMAELMSEMAEVMQSGQMTSEQQAQCAGYMKRLSGLMHDMAGDPQQEETAQRQRELQKLEKEWDYWKDEHEEH